MLSPRDKSKFLKSSTSSKEVYQYRRKNALFLKGLALTVYPRPDQGGILRIEVKIRNPQGEVFKVNRNLPLSKRDALHFKEYLRKFLSERKAFLLSKDAIKLCLEEAFRSFTGKPLPQRKKAVSSLEVVKNLNSNDSKSLEWFCVLYLKHTAHTRSKKTVEVNLCCFKEVSKKLGKVPVSELNMAHLLEYQAERKACGVSNRKVNMEIGFIRKVLNWACDMGLIERHNIKKFPMLPETKRVHSYLTEEELKVFLNALNHHPLLKYRVLFNVLTGLRPKEISYLEWSDIDLENKLLFVRSKPENQVKDKEERVIPLCDKAVEILKKIKELKKEGRYVFSKNGRPVYEISPQLRRASIKANLLKKVFPYMLRHTFAVMSLRAGVDIYALKELMGHSSIETTERYLHTDPLHLKACIEKFGNYVKFLDESQREDFHEKTELKF